MDRIDKPIKCSNCGKKGHSHKKCSEPVLSLGIIAIKNDEIDGRNKYLLIQRKNTIGFIEIIKGRISDDIEIAKRLVTDLTFYERHFLANKPFRILWNMICYGSRSPGYEEAREKFNKFSDEGIQIGDQTYKLQD